MLKILNKIIKLIIANIKFTRLYISNTETTHGNTIYKFISKKILSYICDNGKISIKFKIIILISY